ncbi:MAG: hypothetical protein ACJ77A_05830 [Actinomycetota bacterium]
MKRTLAVLAVSAAVVVGAAGPAAAKGEGPVGATITGPGLSGPGGPGTPGGSGSGGSDEGPGGPGGTAVGTIELRDRSFAGFENTPMWRLATFSGAVPNCSACYAFIDTSPPTDRASLGPVYRVTYFEGRCCQHATTQFLYPYAPGGPWAHTMASPPRDFFLGQQRAGWWHADGRMGQLFLRFLHHIGIPRQDPITPTLVPPKPAPVPKAEAAAAPAASGSRAPWRLPLAVAAMVALLALGAVAARPRSSTRPA